MRRFFITLLVIVAAGGTAYIAFRRFSAKALPSEVNGQQVAAYVNNVPIFESAVEEDAVQALQGAKAVLANPSFSKEQKQALVPFGITATSTLAEVRPVVLQFAISREVLTQAGLQRSLVADDEVRKTIAEQKSMALNDPKGKEFVASAAAGLGVSGDAYWDDPRVFEVYKRMMAAGAMQQYIAAHMTKAEQDAPRPVDQATADFITAEHPQIVIIKEQ